jgi:hypothetical protein
MKIYIPVSKIAACCGLNPYVKDKQVLADYKKRFVERNSDNSRVTLGPDDTIVTTNTDIQDAIQLAIKRSFEKAEDALELVEEVKQKIVEATDLSKGEKRELTKQVASQVFTKFGSEHESITAQSSNIDINRTRIYLCTSFHQIDDIDFVVSGVPDGFETIGSKTNLIEIKNRVKRLFHTVPVYELVQVQAYLWLYEQDTPPSYPEIHSAKLIEQYGQTIETHVVVRDTVFFDKIIKPKLIEFCECLCKELKKS